MSKIILDGNFHKLDIPKMEKYYGATYVGDFPLPEGEGFAEKPIAIFWRPEKLRTSQYPEYFGIVHVEYSTYFKTAMYKTTDAGYIVDYIFNGLEHDGKIVYSHYKDHIAGHRLSEESDDAVCIQGGFDFCEWDAMGTDAKLVRLQVQGPAITKLD